MPANNRCTRVRVRGALLTAAVIAGGLFAPVASAVPPGFSGGELTIPFPGPGATVIVNLRAQGVITGTAPIQVGTQQGVLLVGGSPYPGFTISPVGFGSNFGAVCVALFNSGSAPIPTGGIQAPLSLLNAQEQSASGLVNVVNGPAAIVDPQNTEACGDPNLPPTANAGPDQSVPDLNADGVESVTLNGSASSDADGEITVYEWLIPGSEGPEVIASGVNPTVTLPAGTTIVTLRVIDDSGAEDGSQTASDTVSITIGANQPPTANAGQDQVINDSDGAPGEVVTLAGSGTDSDGQIQTYEWLNGTTSLGTGASLQTRLADGVQTITLVVTDNAGATATDTVQITVNAAQAPTANAGADLIVTDTDGQAGELVALSGSASTTPVGSIVSYDWFLLEGSESRTLLGSGVTINAQLPDGVNTVILEVTNSGQQISSDTVLITVNAPSERTVLADLPNLTPNQQRMASALDGICSRVLVDESTPSIDAEKPSLAASGKVTAHATAEEQADLSTKCRRLLFNNTAANQVEALDELNGEDFAAARTQTLLFANTQYASVMDRLMALRGGARGLSIAGLNIIIDGKPIPVATLQKMAGKLLGSGASSDADEPGGLLSDKWGLWLRGNYSFGEKEDTAASPSFDADQWAVVGGIDYRLSDRAVLGGSLSYGNSSVDFNPSGEGALDTQSWAASLYGSMYAAKNFYFDGIFNVANSSYDATRNITYVDGEGLVDTDASGDTDGLTLSGGLSGGYDFLLGGLTVSPNLGVFYIDATIDEFAESGAGGLNLIYDEQNFKSLTANLGIRLTYAWKLSWGVVLPHLRADFVREFEDDVNVFGVRFAADPEANNVPPILVETDNPDTSYWRLAGGFSAQFGYGISGYIEYQRLEGFEFISFEDVSLGLRMQHSF